MMTGSRSASLPRRRVSTQRRSAKLELACAQLGMALELRQSGPRDDAAPHGAADEPSMVDCLLGRPMRRQQA